jgi:predicted metalloprotease with PDZ domain
MINLLLTLWRLTVCPTCAPAPTIGYTLRLDRTHLDVVDVEMQLRGAPDTFHLAMRVHAEYDARYWRYVEDLRVEQTADDGRATIAREDSTLWRVTLPGGRGVIRYRIHVQPPEPNTRRAWMPYVRADGASINGPDFFLYLPGFPTAPVTLQLRVPDGWRVATAFPGRGSVAMLLDSPILAGRLREWSFSDRGTRYHVVYWPLPAAAAFDTTAFVAELQGLTRAALDVFGSAPTSEYYFLVQDGADDALEHRGSVTIGVSSSNLARDPHASLTEIGHEFFHSWNLVAIHPLGYNALDYRPPRRTPSLWFGEGVTLHYADVLARRAGLIDSTPTRLEHLASLLSRYYGSPAIQRVSPARASLAFEDSPVTNPDATGGYYIQGELLGEVIDARIRSATNEQRSLDDVLRAMYARSRAPKDSGYTAQDLETVADSVCGCDLSALFAEQVRSTGPIDLTPVLSRLGLLLVVDTIPAADAAGQPIPDQRLHIDFAGAHAPAPLYVAISNPATAWARAGLRTGDELVAINGTPIRAFSDFQTALRALRIGDRASVELRRGGAPLTITVPVSGYTRSRARLIDAPNVTAEQRSHREAWMRGH